ncbi:MAG: hypothetical protein PHY56_00800 [Candidatus Omnitrophica bacterium]|nr:hypothetical protein [Candidatus Omnitrophota bacterium]
MSKPRRNYNDPVLCDFNKVELSVPRLKLVRLLFKKSYLTQDEAIFLRGLLWKTESANNKILHVQSIVEKALLKSCT